MAAKTAAPIEAPPEADIQAAPAASGIPVDQLVRLQCVRIAADHTRGSPLAVTPELITRRAAVLEAYVLTGVAPDDPDPENPVDNDG